MESLLLEPTVLAAAAITCLVAAVVQGMSGFAFGMITMGVLTLILNARDASILVTFLAGTSAIHTLSSVRTDFKWSRLRPLALGSLFGLPLGVAILLWTDPSWLKRVVGVALIAISALHLSGWWQPTKAPTISWGYGTGWLGGVLGGSLSIGGPPVVVYTMAQPWAPAQVKATLLSFFLMGLTIKAVLLVAAGAVTLDHLAHVALMVPLVLLGTSVGIRLFNRVDRTRFHQIVYLLLIILGAQLVW
ncbi:MAG: sulfite exporter TauE/SafE family protein [Candidatus Latescibacteria bacterium]|nr:sulfite exporter TauE/SafE family protein [Candidatus Latescibacterota bacterium]